MKYFGFLRHSLLAVASVAALWSFGEAKGCTGISFKAADGSYVVGRTMEWGSFVMNSRYMIVPRGYTLMAQTPSGDEGMKITAKYGYVGIGVLKDNLLAEGINEKGLVGELFYFPGYGVFEKYDPKYNSTTIEDGQFLSWALANFATIDEMEQALKEIHVVPYGRGFGTAHFRLADSTGRQVVVEYLDGTPTIFEDRVGVVTNAPSFDFQMLNLNNYVNIMPGSAPSREIMPGVELRPFGAGSASLGLPGDVTPPSRFVRAVFYVSSARTQPTGYKAVLQTFQILNNFDVPVGIEYPDPKIMPDMLSATQWTAVADIQGRKFYYRTQYNSSLRCIDLNTIDFGKVKFQLRDLDLTREQPIEYLKIS